MDLTQCTTVDLIRHGHCQGGEIFRGSTDVELSDVGWQQMTAQLADEGGWNHVFSSPLKRCRLFSENFSEQKKLPLTVIDGLQEIYFGDWEGRPQEEIINKYAEQLNSYWMNPMSYTPPNGETMEAFKLRVEAAIDQVLNAQKGQHNLVVAHGAVIRVVFRYLLNMPFSSFSLIEVPYAAMSRFKIYHQADSDDWMQLIMHRGTPPL